MITVNFRTSVMLSDILGDWKFQIIVPDNTKFIDLLFHLDKKHGKKLRPYLFEKDRRTPASHIMFMVNGRNIRFLDGQDTLLKDQDQVTILLPAGGG